LSPITKLGNDRTLKLKNKPIKMKSRRGNP
jgi:hypothetical protein